ncbi:anion abc transporter permease [Bacillus sp. OxB-1]|uniref:CynX/NimT family MFS transporter n=1 Tax=Bacillus sp. (strain OxB-1) TaxID=98228 RepID=UPI0005820DDB|nr:MFS transporter [Bacillus sp. OxB-1]BAQ10744.1 anion abc transporter permease [Bacillus sp. OxB-1]
MKQNTAQHTTRKLQFPGHLWLLIIGIVCIASTLRSPLTSVGPIIEQIREGTGISNLLAGFLTTIPLLAFAIISPFVPKLSRRFGLEKALFFSLCLLLAGTIIRSLGATPPLLIGTFLIGIAIAFGNVLLPSLLKLSFPLHVGLMTGIYSMSMNISATLASGVAVPIATGTSFGWQGALGVWGVLAFIAVIVWLPQLRSKNRVAVPATNKTIGKDTPLWRSPIAWSVTFFMGLQSLLFYTTSAWIPEVLKSDGMSANRAGWMLSLLQFSQLPMTFIIPILADKVKSQRTIVLGVVLLFVLGYGGVVVGGAAFTPLWMILIGIAGGAAFGLAMMFFTLRTHTPQQAAELSGMAQAFGYALAAVGPVLFGSLHDVSGNWTVPMTILFVAIALLLVSGLQAGKNAYAFPKDSV